MYIQHATSLGGSVTSLLYLIEKLPRNQWEPTVICIGKSMAVVEFFRSCKIPAFLEPGITVFPHTTGGWYRLFSPRGFWHFVRSLIAIPRTFHVTQELVKRHQPDVVHLNSIVLLPCALALRGIGRSCIVHIRESIVNGHFGIRRAIIRNLLLNISAQLIFISNDEHEKLLSSEKGIVIPDFVDFKYFDSALDRTTARIKLGFEKDDKIILFLGGFSHIKGSHTFLKSVHEIRKRYPGVKVVITSVPGLSSTTIEARIGRFILPLLGQPTDRQKANKLIDSLDLSKSLILRGFINNVPDFMAACDILVFPSVEPHFARPVIEAAAMARPVVASRIGGVEELVIDGVTGVLVDPKNHQMLAHAVICLLEDSKLSNELSQRAFHYAKDKYDADKNASATFQMYT